MYAKWVNVWPVGMEEEGGGGGGAILGKLRACCMQEFQRLGRTDGRHKIFSTYTWIDVHGCCMQVWGMKCRESEEN